MNAVESQQAENESRLEADPNVRRYWVTDIQWDCTFVEFMEAGLPLDHTVFRDDPDDIADALSDEFGWAVLGFQYEEMARVV